jgi:RND family efflux transporter MFP subunit
VPEVEPELKVRAAKVKQAQATLKQAQEAAHAAKAAREAARADVDAKLATIHSAEAQVLRWQAEDERSRRLVGRGIYDQQTADEVVNQLRASEASRDEAKAKWISAKATFEQASAQYDKAEADVEVARANVDVAQADHDQWRDWLSYAQITAPYDGVITHRNVHSGHFLQPVNSGSTSKAAEPLFVMMRTDVMRCIIEVPEFDAVLIRDEKKNDQGEVVRHGDKALIRYQALPGVETVGEVTRFSYSLDEHARTLRVEVHLPNPDGKLRPGTYVNVTILAKLRDVLALPADAILNDILADGDRPYCYMPEGGTVHKTFLDVGARCDEGVQVLRKQRPGGKGEPITGKELVVADPKKKDDGAPSRLVGPKALQDGQTVQVLSATAR